MSTVRAVEAEVCGAMSCQRSARDGYWGGMTLMVDVPNGGSFPMPMGLDLGDSNRSQMAEPESNGRTGVTNQRRSELPVPESNGRAGAIDSPRLGQRETNGDSMS